MIQPGRMLRQVLDSVLRRPATVMYPYVKVSMPDRFRGKIIFHPEKCIGCKLCVKDCPSKAITIRKTGDKQFEAEFEINKCVFCAQCVDSCAKKALESTQEYELAQLDPKKFKIVFKSETAPAPKSEVKPV
jgi:formate hydrogenlyase subunit 6/NADH:ubiquinone oxidoreductase subunit I